jgi:hypothetical protein
LLGQYLGDGHVTYTGRGTSRSQVLRVYGDDRWPGIQGEISSAMLRVLPVNVFTTQKQGCTSVESISLHWRCLLPQQGPGKKHERAIELADWQLRLLTEDPRPFIRGLLHSDGCRTTNRVVTRGTSYAYTRYFFSNQSRDILRIFGDCLELVDIPWRYTRRNAISVAQRRGVEALDAFVGPKY